MTARNSALALALALCATAASAAIEIHVFVPGVPGESVSDGYKNWIDIDSLSVGVAERSCSGLHVSKRLDKSSPILSAAAIAGSIYPNMTVSIVNATQSPGAEFLTYTLANVAVKAINQGGSTGGGTFSEQISLSPDTITIAYRPQKADGSLDTAIQFSINCPKSK